MKRVIWLIVVLVMAVMAFPPIVSADRHGHFHRGGVWIGAGWGPWWGPWWGGYGYPYPYYYTPYYAAPYYSPPAVIDEGATFYSAPAEQREEEHYWYYCRDPKGYYPYVGRCPSGWLKVIPTPPPDRKE